LNVNYQKTNILVLNCVGRFWIPCAWGSRNRGLKKLQLELGGNLAAGCFVEPTIVRAKPDDRVAQEEVFGPFVTVLTFSDDEEALAIANGTTGCAPVFGLKTPHGRCALPSTSARA
jgi:delta 1-pyrroline-5-carboxylate dehydrogenase